MARVLCAWEFGGDLGHVRRLIPIAAALRDMGHAVCVAFRDSAYLEAARGRGIEAFVAPLLRLPATVNPSPLNLSDVLLNLGFDDRLGLAGALRAWRGLFDLVAPDVVVADYAPGALVAARAAGLRSVTVGSGFALPRFEDPLPALRPWAKADSAVLRALDDRLVASVASALPAGSPRKPRLARDIFEADAHVLCTFPEIDPMGRRDGVTYVGPQADDESGIEMPWTQRELPRVFAYLKPRSPRFAAMLDGLRALDAEVVVAAPGLDAAAARAASTARMRIAPAAVNLGPLLADASLCVSHAGAGLTARAVACGVPMALLPQHLEQFLIARRVAEAGSGAVSSPEDAAPDYRAWLAAILGDGRYREAAARLAATHRDHSFAGATLEVARRVTAIASA